jgi:RecB family exonuclease
VGRCCVRSFYPTPERANTSKQNRYLWRRSRCDEAPERTVTCVAAPVAAQTSTHQIVDAAVEMASTDRMLPVMIRSVETLTKRNRL